MARSKRLLLLAYDEEAASETGVVCAVAGPVPYSKKEPVGHIFHYKVMLQQGLIGKAAAFRSCCGHALLAAYPYFDSSAADARLATPCHVCSL